jgi:hypothetical protein
MLPDVFFVPDLLFFFVFHGFYYDCVEKLHSLRGPNSDTMTLPDFSLSSPPPNLPVVFVLPRGSNP